MDTIVCPVDFSPCSANAAMYAAHVAAEFNARLILVHCYESPLLYADAGVVTVHDIDKAIQSVAEKNILKLKNKLLAGNKRLRIETLIKDGITADEVTGMASWESADIIIMGTTGKGKAKQILMGSTSVQVISKAHCPVLCVPKEETYHGIKRIVFATDLNEDNINAALNIVPIAKHFKAEIIFLFVDDKHILHSEENISNMSRKIRSHVRYTKISGYISKNTSISDGIEYFLKKNPADLLVMFTHVKHFPRSVFSPSITKKMSRQTHIPLLALSIKDRPLTAVL